MATFPLPNDNGNILDSLGGIVQLVEDGDALGVGAQGDELADALIDAGTAYEMWVGFCPTRGGWREQRTERTRLWAGFDMHHRVW